MTSLEGWGSAIELRPHRPSQQRCAPRVGQASHGLAYRFCWLGTALDGGRRHWMATAKMCRDGLPEATPELTSGNTTLVTVLPAANGTEAA